MRQGAGLFTDLYELTMAASYHDEGLDSPATFDLYVRSLPPARRFLVVCGLEQALDHIGALRFEEDEVAHLATLGLFGDAFLHRLAHLRFSGEVWAMPEGEVAFPGEPLVRLTAPMVEATLVETALINLVGHATMVASKAARVALACEGRPFVDFAARRTHGPDAALYGARASWVGGAEATSLVEAGRRWGLPLSGTMAHAYVLRFPSEIEAFRTYARSARGQVTLLVDTYDSEEGARRAAQVAAEGLRVDAVRLDSGDLDRLARRVRAILDESGCRDVRIVASGDLDECVIADLVSAGAPIDAFGVGTRLGTSADAPWLGTVYKLAEDADGPKAKRSTGKATLPGRKQVWRRRDRLGVLAGDTIALEDEPAEGAPVLERVMEGGRRMAPAPPLAEARDRCTANLAALPAALRDLGAGPVDPYPVVLSDGLGALVSRLEAAPA